MDEVVRQLITRRRFLQLGAVAAVAAACSPAGTSTSSSAPAGSTAAGSSGPGGSTAVGGSGAPAGSGAAVTGTVNVSYPDEAGLKPKYVEQAAAALKAQYSGVDVKIDRKSVV